MMQINIANTKRDSIITVKTLKSLPFAINYDVIQNPCDPNQLLCTQINQTHHSKSNSNTTNLTDVESNNHNKHNKIWLYNIKENYYSRLISNIKMFDGYKYVRICKLFNDKLYFICKRTDRGLSVRYWLKIYTFDCKGLQWHLKHKIDLNGSSIDYNQTKLFTFNCLNEYIIIFEMNIRIKMCFKIYLRQYGLTQYDYKYDSKNIDITNNKNNNNQNNNNNNSSNKSNYKSTENKNTLSQQYYSAKPLLIYQKQWFLNNEEQSNGNGNGNGSRNGNNGKKLQISSSSQARNEIVYKLNGNVHAKTYTNIEEAEEKSKMNNYNYNNYNNTGSKTVTLKGIEKPNAKQNNSSNNNGKKRRNSSYSCTASQSYNDCNICQINTYIDEYTHEAICEFLIFGGSKRAFFESFQLIIYNLKRQKLINIIDNPSFITKNIKNKLFSFIGWRGYYSFGCNVIDYNRYLLLIGGILNPLAQFDESRLKCYKKEYNNKLIYFDFYKQDWFIYKYKLPQSIGHVKSTMLMNTLDIHIFGNDRHGKYIHWSIDLKNIFFLWKCERLLWIAYYKNQIIVQTQKQPKKHQKYKKMYTKSINLNNSKKNKNKNELNEKCFLGQMPKMIIKCIISFLHTKIQKIQK